MTRRLAVGFLVALFAGSAFAKLPFIEDNYKQAVARARTEKLPIFVEAWAPW